MKNLMVLVVLSLSASVASANGVTQGGTLAQEVAAAMGARTVVCTSDTDRVTLSKDSAGELRMVALYAGSISGQLDTDNEGYGEECGGLAVKFSAQYSDYLLEDTYNDCERGNWGYSLTISKADLNRLGTANAKFETHSYALDQDSRDGAVRTLECAVN